MYRALKVLASCGAVLAAGCGDGSRISADLQNDLALASAGADLELASRPTDPTSIVGAVERATPPARAVTRSTRAPRPRPSPMPRVAADVQPETEIVQEPEVAAVEQPLPAPAPIEEAPVEVAASARPRAIEPSSGGAGPSGRGTDWGTIIGIAGAVVIRGGGVGEDRCIPPGAGRGRRPIAINERFPQPRGRGTGRVAKGGGRTTGPVVRTAPARPRDIAVSRPSPPPPLPTARSRPVENTGGSPGNPKGSSTVAQIEKQ